MSKNSIADYDTSAASNTDIAGINIDEGCDPAGINDAIRTLMAHLASYRDGRVIGTDIQAQNANLQSLSGLTLTADRMLYATGANTLALTGISSIGRTLVATTTKPLMRDFLEIPERVVAAITDTGDANHNDLGVYSGAVLRSAILSIANGVALGVNQTWQDLTSSRSAGTSYQNTTGKPIQVALRLNTGASGLVQVSTDNASWVTLGVSNSSAFANVSFVVPHGYYYRVTGVTAASWAELR